ncbi:MAG: hypothetical protein RLY87_737 [Chloroflexota bacterium]|jgi:predicted MPP superfamily phosphohydrolase
MRREPRPLRQPETPDTLPTIAVPADVEFSVAWRFVLALASVWFAIAVLKKRWWTLATFGFVGGALWRYARHHEPARPTVVTRTISDSRWGDALEGFTIAQISDIHLGQPHSDENLEWTIGQLLTLRPDIIVLTGDLVNNRPALSRLSMYLHRLHAPCGVYAIAGNHDYAENIDDVRAALEFVGIPLLQNQGKIVQYRGASLWLAGVDDIWHGNIDIAAAVQSAPGDMPIVLLAHSPDTVREASAHAAVVLQLSGHVHGGHIRLPLLGPLARPRFGRLYTHGTQRVGSVHLHISLGLGGRPVRLGNPPELTFFRCVAERTIP